MSMTTNDDEQSNILDTLAAIQESLRLAEEDRQLILQMNAENVRKGVEEMKKEVTLLKEFFEAKIEDLNDQVNEQEKTISEQSLQMEEMRQKIVDLTARSMRNNLVFSGPSLPAEAPRESFHDSEHILKEVIQKAGITNCPEIERAHRIGAHQAGRGARWMVARFQSWKGRESILGNRDRLRSCGILVREQLPPEILQIRRDLRAAAEAQWGKLGDGTQGTIKIIHEFDAIKYQGRKFWLRNGQLTSDPRSGGPHTRQGTKRSAPTPSPSVPPSQHRRPDLPVGERHFR